MIYLQYFGTKIYYKLPAAQEQAKNTSVPRLVLHFTDKLACTMQKNQVNSDLF